MQYAPMMNSAAVKLAARLAARRDKEASLNLNGILGTMTLEVRDTVSHHAKRAACRAGVLSPGHPGAARMFMPASAGQRHSRVVVSLANALWPIGLLTIVGWVVLQVIGTSAFGVEFDTDKEDSRVVKEAQVVLMCALASCHAILPLRKRAALCWSSASLLSMMACGCSCQPMHRYRSCLPLLYAVHLLTAQAPKQPESAGCSPCAGARVSYKAYYSSEDSAESTRESVIDSVAIPSLFSRCDGNAVRQL